MKKNLIFMMLLACLVIVYSDKFDDGVRQYRNGDYNAALESFKNCYPRDSRIYYNIGNCYYRLENIPVAAAYYLRSLRLNPGMDEALSNLRLIAGDDLAFNSTIFVPISRSLVYILEFLLVAIFLINLNYRLIKNKKGMSSFQITLLILLIVFSIYSAAVYINAQKEFGIVEKDTILLSSPSSDGVQTAEVFSGNVMDVEIKGKNYSKIRDNHGVSGWIKNSEILFVKDI